MIDKYDATLARDSRTIAHLRTDKFLLEQSILKLIQEFEGKFSVHVNQINMECARVMTEPHKTNMITIELKL